MVWLQIRHKSIYQCPLPHPSCRSSECCILTMDHLPYPHIQLSVTKYHIACTWCCLRLDNECPLLVWKLAINGPHLSSKVQMALSRYHVENGMHKQCDIYQSFWIFICFFFVANTNFHNICMYFVFQYQQWRKIHLQPISLYLVIHSQHCMGFNRLHIL